MDRRESIRDFIRKLCAKSATRRAPLPMADNTSVIVLAKGVFPRQAAETLHELRSSCAAHSLMSEDAHP